MQTKNGILGRNFNNKVREINKRSLPVGHSLTFEILYLTLKSSEDSPATCVGVCEQAYYSSLLSERSFNRSLCQKSFSDRLKERVRRLLFTDGRGWSMTRINDGFIRKNQYFFLNALDELRIISALKVCPSDAALK